MPSKKEYTVEFRTKRSGLCSRRLSRTSRGAVLGNVLDQQPIRAVGTELASAPDHPTTRRPGGGDPRWAFARLTFAVRHPGELQRGPHHGYVSRP